MLNCFELLFFHINLHSVHHNDKAKTELSQLRKLIKSKKTEISTLYKSSYTLNSVLSWSTFTASSLFGYDMTSFAYQNLAVICHSPHLFTSQALSGWMGTDAHFSGSPEIFDCIHAQLWLGHSRTFTALCISHSCCVLRVTVLLEDKPSAQSEVLNALDWVFIKAISIFWCIELFFYSDESLSPCRWKTAPQHEAATSTLYFGRYIHIYIHIYTYTYIYTYIYIHTHIHIHIHIHTYIYIHIHTYIYIYTYTHIYTYTYTHTKMQLLQIYK